MQNRFPPRGTTPRSKHSKYKNKLDILPAKGPSINLDRPERPSGKKKKNMKVKVKAKCRPPLDQTQQGKPDKTLWDCTTIPEVEELQAQWFKTFSDKALGALKSEKLYEVHDKVQALMGKKGATSSPLIVNDAVCHEAYRFLRDVLIAAHEADAEVEFKMVTLIAGEGITSHYKTVIDLAEARKRAQRTLRAMAPHHFGVVELSLFNSHGHPGGGQVLQVHEHAIIWGTPEELSKAADVAKKHGKKFAPNTTDAAPIKIRPVPAEPVNLARVAAYLFKPPHKCKNWNPPRDGKKGHMNSSEAGDRSTRYLRMALLRSLLSIEDITYASGQGLKGRSDMIRFLRELSKREAGNGKEDLHPDAIASFWVDVKPLICNGDHWNLPINKRRA